MHKALGQIFLILLVVYFISRIALAVDKLQDRMIGTMTKRVTSSKVRLPSLTLCVEPEAKSLDMGKKLKKKALAMDMQLEANGGRFPTPNIDFLLNVSILQENTNG